MKAIKERLYYGAREFNNLFPGGMMSEQPTCTTCSKPYFKNYPDAKDGCKCPPDKRRVLKDVPTE
jgi:hypothetical protein